MRILLLILLMVACHQEKPTPGKKVDSKALAIHAKAIDILSPIQRLKIKADDPRMKNIAFLGRALIHNKSVFKNSAMNCLSCHNQQYGHGNNHVIGKGLPRDSDSWIFTKDKTYLYRDGRFDNMSDVLTDHLIGNQPYQYQSVEKFLRLISLRDNFNELIKNAYQSTYTVTLAQLAEAIVTYLRSRPKTSKYDRFLAGDFSALDEQMQRGLNKFIEFDCVQCHGGSLLGGYKTQVSIYAKKRRGEDRGLAAFSKDKNDEYVFVAPSLRNSISTAPYFHDGSVKTLEAAIELMATHQLNLKISKDDVRDLKAFLIATSSDLYTETVAKFHEFNEE